MNRYAKCPPLALSRYYGPRPAYPLSGLKRTRTYVGSASQRQVRGDVTILCTSVVDAESPRAKRYDLEQPTSHHHVLEEVNHLVRVSKIAMEGGRSGQRKKCERNGGQTSPETRRAKGRHQPP